MPIPHATRSPAEQALCEEMERQGVSHAHRSLHFRVRPGEGEPEGLEPDIVVHRGSILFAVVCLAEDGDREARARLLARFLEQHSPEIVLVVVAPPQAVPEIPAESYDEIYEDADPAAVVRRIREQNPNGMIRPFAKPRPTSK